MSTALFEHAYYIGNYMSGILYGVELVLYAQTIQNLRRTKSARYNISLMLYSTVLLFLLTIDISVNAVWGEQMWITFRDGPGGVPGFIAGQSSVWYQAMGSSAVVAIIFMGDALLIHRCFLLWDSDFRVVILPILMYLGAFALSVAELVASFVPAGNFFGAKAAVFGTPYYALTISLNILVTLLICGRLSYLRKEVENVLGPERSKLYTNIITILIESAAPYSIMGIMFLVPYARGSLIAISFGQVWAKLACISPQLIILRVSAGKAWSKDTLGQGVSTSMDFVGSSTRRSIEATQPHTLPSLVKGQGSLTDQWATEKP